MEPAVAIEKDARAPWATWEYPHWIGLAVRALYLASVPEGATT
jgi:hypothetical protein